mmetsp:Transcript_27355/g.72181  ORF Transcript_27355/g.72181 Transcript_27355/m.72181 type:complete len:240 (-) Transcript_27355:907-1626(-)
MSSDCCRASSSTNRRHTTSCIRKSLSSSSLPSVSRTRRILSRCATESDRSWTYSSSLLFSVNFSRSCRWLRCSRFRRSSTLDSCSFLECSICRSSVAICAARRSSSPPLITAWRSLVTKMSCMNLVFSTISSALWSRKSLFHSTLAMRRRSVRVSLSASTLSLPAVTTAVLSRRMRESSTSAASPLSSDSVSALTSSCPCLSLRNMGRSKASASRSRSSRSFSAFARSCCASTFLRTAL